MKNIKIKDRKDQHSVSLFNGLLHENKPLSGEPLYSNLIYWAHVEAPGDGEFPMHPHKGIEILTFIFEGSLEHFDTASNKWTPLLEGGVQHIQAGSGLQHSEKYRKGSRAFQIWLDPDFNKALFKRPFYKDYQADSFSWEIKGELQKLVYVGEEGPIKTDAQGIQAIRYKLASNQHAIELSRDKTYSIYILNGKVNLEGATMIKDSFTKVSNLEMLHLDVEESADIFVLESPTVINYRRVFDQ